MRVARFARARRGKRTLRADTRCSRDTRTAFWKLGLYGIAFEGPPEQSVKC